MKLTITKVISYKNSWQTINLKYSDILNDLNNSLSLIQPKHIDPMDSEEDLNYHIKNVLKENKWEQIRYGSSVFNQGDKRLKTINYFKNRIGLTLSKVNRFNIWLFQDAQVMSNDNIIDLPILLAPLKSTSKSNRTKKINQFETIKQDLVRLEPLVLNYPFLILGYEFTSSEKTIDITEIKFNEFESRENVIIERFIEFAPQYYQAGINIISFFGNYIKQQYPNEDVTVSIEQHNDIVRLKIVTHDGKTEIIEKALEDYQMVFSGKKNPEDITNKPSLILELRNEIRIAKLRIESQQDIIGLQKSTIEKLFDIVGNGLAKQTPVLIDFKPSMSQSTSVVFNQKISSTFGTLTELKDLISGVDEIQHKRILELEKALQDLEKEQNPELVKKSSGMSKFKRFIFDFTDKESSLYNILEKFESGLDIAQDLAGKYNSIAEWCGLPQVPRIFSK